MPSNKLCITFAGPVGSSKTPIAYFLSQEFNLPIFNNDAIRTEVIEDLGKFDETEYLRRRNQRGDEFLVNEYSFIDDVSIDRGWKELEPKLLEHNYKVFIISLDLSKDLLLKLYQAKGYQESIVRLDQLLLDHQIFLDQYGHLVNLHITDQDFPNRFKICKDQLSHFLTSS